MQHRMMFATPMCRRSRLNLSSYQRFIFFHKNVLLRTHGVRTSNTTTSQGRNGNHNPFHLGETVKAVGIGSLAGFCGSLVGMGGGFVMIPLMTSPLLRLSQHMAHGTSLFAVAATGLAGALSYSGEVDLESALAIASCGVFTARFGAQATAYLSAHTLKRVLGVFMVMVAPVVPAREYLINYHKDDKPSESKNRSGSISSHEHLEISLEAIPASTSSPSNFLLSLDSSVFLNRVLPSAAIGVFSGFLAGLLGVGGGAVVVPALTLATDMTHYQALGTSLCAMSVPAMVGTFTHFRQGNVALRVAPALAIGAFIGAYAGGKIGLQLNENALRWGFSGLMVFLGVRTLLQVR